MLDFSEFNFMERILVELILYTTVALRGIDKK